MFSHLFIDFLSNQNVGSLRTGDLLVIFNLCVPSAWRGVGAQQIMKTEYRILNLQLKFI